MESASIARPATSLAGFGLRLVSYLIDFLVIFIPSMIISTILSLGSIAAAGTESEAGIMAALIGSLIGSLIIMVLALGYILYTWSIGNSVGMKVVGLRMIRADTGEAPGFVRALIRLLVAIVSGIPLYLGYLWVLWDEKKQTWHDKAAGTLVVKV